MRISDWSSDVCSSDLVLGEHLARLFLRFLDDAADLLVDQLRGGAGDGLAARYRVAEKNLFLVIDVAQAAELVAHAPLGDHAAGHAGGLLDVVAGAGGDVLGAVDQQRHPAGHQHRSEEHTSELQSLMRISYAV